MRADMNIEYVRESGHRYMRGASLIEVLVTVLVLTIGLLGIAGLQIQSTRSNYEAFQRTTATTLAHDIIERMRTNVSATGTYVTSGANLGGGSLGDTEPTPNCKSASTCSPAQLATYDLWEWEQVIDGAAETTAGGGETGGLSMPTGCITGPGGTGLYTVSIAWRGQTPTSNPVTGSCGEGSGKYDEGGDSDVYRQLLSVRVFIDAG